MKKKTCGIYVITNQVNGKVYVGKSIDVPNRWRQHKWDLNKNKHGNAYLQNAWNKYGAENFSFELLEECEEEILHLKEMEWVCTFSTTNRELGYNIREEDENNKLSEETKAHLRASAYETYNRLVEEGYYTCILYNLNNNTFTEYNSSQEAKANSSISKNKKSNFNKGEVIIPKRLFTQNKLDKIINRYNRYKETQANGSTKSDTIYVVNAYDFTDVKLFPSKTNACTNLFKLPNETNEITKVIDTTRRFRWYYFFSSEESMNTTLPTCHKVCTREEHGKIYTTSEPRYKYILNHPDNPPVYLYKAIDAINHIPNSTTKGIKKLITGEKPHYYNYTLEKIGMGVEEIYS